MQNMEREKTRPEKKQIKASRIVQRKGINERLISAGVIATPLDKGASLSILAADCSIRCMGVPHSILSLLLFFLSLDNMTRSYRLFYSRD